MSRQLPYLAMDGVLCDYPQPGCVVGGKHIYARDNFSNTTKKEAKMAHVMTNKEVKSRAERLVAKLLGQDAALDDEAAEKLKGFLKSRLSAEDHEQVCNMLAGGDVDAEDDLPENAAGGPLPKKASLAGDSAGFAARFPGLAHIKIDNSGIAIPKRAASYSDAGVKSFAERYPGLAHVRQG